MAENIVAGLFGLTPQMYGEQQRRSALQEGIDLAQLLQVSPGLVSDMLNGKKAFSKNSIRILSQHFRLKQEAFNSELRNWKTFAFFPTT